MDQLLVGAAVGRGWVSQGLQSRGWGLWPSPGFGLAPLLGLGLSFLWLGLCIPQEFLGCC